jgi:HAMP domain-containing protein
LLSIATQINEKKQLIITKVTEAISAGCSFGMATAIINGVTVGVGSTVVGDYAYIKKYSGLDNYSSSNPFSSDDTLTLSASNSGTGYFSGFTANAGSTVGTYYTVFYDGFASPPTICATRTAEIDALATEINTLRSQINVALIVNTNTIKDRKTSSEVFVWGYKSRDKKVRNFTSNNDTVMSTIRNESAFQ